MISSFIYAGILILVIFLAPIAFPIVYASNDDDDALLRFFVADRPYSRMEVPGMNSSMVDLSGNASSQAIVYPQREREFYNYASSGECKYCAGYGIPADGYNHTIYFTDQDLEAERAYSGIEYSTSI